MKGFTMEILIVGGGYIGMYTVRRLERLLRRGEANVTVVDPRGYMTYQPFLAEAAGGSEEHTSELQSRRDLVCRLLLEKKKKVQLRSPIEKKKKKKKKYKTKKK